MKRLLAAVSLLAACAGGATLKVPTWQGSSSPVSVHEHVVVQDAAGWGALWERLERPAPAADFSTHFGVAVFVGDKRPGEYRFGWSYQTSEDRAVVTVGYVAERTGDDDGPKTRPYAVFLFPRSIAKPGAEVRVVDETPGGALAL